MASTHHGAQVRVALSLVLCLLLILEMLHDLTGDLLHELFALLFAVALIVHIVLSRKWISAAWRGALQQRTRKAKNVVRLVVMLVLLIVAVVLAITSLLISHVLEEAGVVFFIPGYDRFTLRIIHTICAYVLCTAALVHIALQYLSVIKAFHIPYDPSRRKILDSVATGAAVLGIIALGISCSADISQRERGSGKGNRQGDGSGKGRGAENGKGHGAGNGQNRANRAHRSFDELSPWAIGDTESTVLGDLPMDLARGVEQDPIMARQDDRTRVFAESMLKRLH